MEKKLYEICTPSAAEIVVKKSKFIGETHQVKSDEEVAQIVAGVKKKYYDARHHCYAYCLADENMVRASDDGEPQGTAGRPILDVITGENLRNTLVIVTRYFGGTLLGTGGLTRAYRDAAKAAIDASELMQRKSGVESRVVIGYEALGKAESFLKESGVTTLETYYGSEVTLGFLAEEELTDSINKKLLEMSSGEAKISVSDPKTYGIVNNRVIWL